MHRSPFGVLLMGALLSYSCQASPSGRPRTGTAGTEMAGIGGGGGDGMGGGAATGGMSGVGGGISGIGGGGISGIGGGGTCPGTGGFLGYGMRVCGPSPTCDGNTLVAFQFCDQRACAGPAKEWTRTECSAGTTCGGGRCLTHVGPAVKACAIATDCGLSPTVCVGDSKQLIFSDPSCDDGECHWKQIVNLCGDSFVPWTCRDGVCSDPGALTRGPMSPMPSPDPMQPPAAPDQACATKADCSQPAPTCFLDSVVSYVQGVCRMGACSWAIDLDECAGSCDGGACVTP